MGIPGNSRLHLRSGGITTVVSRWSVNYLQVILMAWAVGIGWSASLPAATDNLEDVRLRLVNGSSIRATINAIEEDGAVLGSRILQNVTLEEITNISTGRSARELESKPVVRLAAGSLIPFSQIAVTGDSARMTSGDQQLDIPLELIRGIVWKRGANVEAAMVDPPSDQDSVIVQTPQGDRTVNGLLESIDATHVSMVYQGKSRRIRLDKVKAVVPAALKLSPPVGTLATIRLVDGATLVGAIESYRENVLTLALSGQQPFTVMAAKVSSISIQTDRIAWLSDLNPVRSEQQSQFVAARNWQRDRSLLGNPIRLKFNASTRIHEFEKGIGTRSYTSLVYENTKDFSQFRAVVGIDVETNGHGDCEMVVEGDGIRLWSQRVRATDDPLPIVVDIAGIREIALIVLPGEDFDLADHADWADARFTRID